MNIRLNDKTCQGLFTPFFFVTILLLMSCDSNPTKSYRESLNWKTFNSANTGGGLVCDRVRCIVSDDQGNLWFGSCGLSKFDGANWESFTETGNTFPYSIDAIAIDSSGNLWLGVFEYYTNKGFVFRFDGSKFTNMDPDTTIFKNKMVWDIAVDADGVVWFATNGRGILFYDGVSWDSVNQRTSFKVSDYVNSAFVDSDNNKWFGAGAQLVKYDGISWVRYAAPTLINSIAQDLNGLLWMCSLSGGAFSFDVANWTVYDTTSSEIISNKVHDVVVDKDNVKWFATDMGACSFDGIDWNIYTTVNSGISSNLLTSVEVDSKGHKWFGTFENGVSVLK